MIRQVISAQIIAEAKTLEALADAPGLTLIGLDRDAFVIGKALTNEEPVKIIARAQVEGWQTDFRCRKKHDCLAVMASGPAVLNFKRVIQHVYRDTIDNTRHPIPGR